MDVGDLAVLAQVPGDLREHAALIVVLARSDGRQVVADVAIDQILHRGGGTPLTFLVGGIFAPVDPLPQRLGFLAGGGDRPCRIAADRDAALDPVDAVVQEK